MKEQVLLKEKPGTCWSEAEIPIPRENSELGTRNSELETRNY
jgi:hypothetical protein